MCSTNTQVKSEHVVTSENLSVSRTQSFCEHSY